jgi:hypothetical protein
MNWANLRWNTHGRDAVYTGVLGSCVFSLCPTCSPDERGHLGQRHRSATVTARGPPACLLWTGDLLVAPVTRAERTLPKRVLKDKAWVQGDFRERFYFNTSG